MVKEKQGFPSRKCMILDVIHMGAVTCLISSFTFGDRISGN
jgi:hypothetical protein